MSKDDLIQITNKSIADYGFRQAVVWSPEDIIDSWGLDEAEADLLTTRIIPKLKDLPIPVEPADREKVQNAFNAILEAAD